jgi:hypothetical protein
MTPDVAGGKHRVFRNCGKKKADFALETKSAVN